MTNKILKKDTSYCQGCHRNIYNTGFNGSKGCFYFEQAKLVKKKQVHVDEKPQQYGDRQKVIIFDCYYRPRYTYID